MKCHRHPDQDAIAICTHCTKGLCAACARDVPGGTACGESCAMAIARAERAPGLRIRALRLSGAFLIVLGASFAGWGGSVNNGFLITTGTLMVTGGAAFCWIARGDADA